jgi:PDZ domain-containing secreted protein
MTITGVRASLLTGQTSGSIFTVDINDSGTSILSTKLTIDNTEKTSTTAATAAVVSDAAIADDAEITIDIDQIGDGTAKGLMVTILYT